MCLPVGLTSLLPLGLICSVSRRGIFKENSLHSILPPEIAIPEYVLSADLDSRNAVLLSLRSDTYFSLSPVAARLWKFWTDNGSVQGSIDRLMQDYQVDRNTAEADVAELIGELEQRGLITVVGRE
jgi:hypothetical protein